MIPLLVHHVAHFLLRLSVSQKLKNTSLLLPERVKKALDMVAADQETTASELLRGAATNIVKTYRDGVFFDLAVQDDAQIVREVVR